MDFSHVFNARRWRERFRSEGAVRDAARAEGRAPDATVDEVGSAPPAHGFEGNDLPGGPGNGQGSGTVGGSGWAGWGA